MVDFRRVTGWRSGVQTEVLRSEAAIAGAPSAGRQGPYRGADSGLGSVVRSFARAGRPPLRVRVVEPPELRLLDRGSGVSLTVWTRPRGGYVAQFTTEARSHGALLAIAAHSVEGLAEQVESCTPRQHPDHAPSLSSVAAEDAVTLLEARVRSRVRHHAIQRLASDLLYTLRSGSDVDHSDIPSRREEAP